jgi:hypothetical protein
MKLRAQKNLLGVASFLMALGQAGNLSAHNQAGSFTTGQAAAVDYYQVTCGTGTDHLSFQVKDVTANSSRVSVQVLKGTSCGTNACARNTTDTTDTDSAYSPLVQVKQGSGVYNLTVKHTAAGSDSYDVLYHCEDASNAHTDTSIVSRQQQ